MICPNCGEINANDSSTCTKCKSVLSSNVTRTNNNTIVIKPRKKRKKVKSNEVLENAFSINEKEVEPVEKINISNDIVIDQGLGSYENNSVETLDIDVSQPEVVSEVEQKIEQLQVSEKKELESENNKKSKKSIFKVLLLILVLILSTLLLLSLFLIVKNKKNENDTKADIITNTTFFIGNGNGKLAVFDDNGNKITDFIYTDYVEFNNGSAIVYQNKKVGVINESGDEIIEIGKYKGIEPSSGLYKVHNKDYEYMLVDSHDNLLYKLDDYEVKTFTGDNNYSILKDKNNKKYSILNTNGKKVLTFDEEEGEPTANSYNNLISIFYSNKNFIVDIKNNKNILTFDSDKQYCISDKSTDNIIVLTTCLQDNKEYQIIQNNEIKNISDKCTGVTVDNNNIICDNKDGKFLLDENYEIGNKVSAKMYLDNSNYVQNNNSTTAEVIKNDESVKELSCRQVVTSGYAYNDIYLLNIRKIGNCKLEEFNYEFYNSSGELAFDKKFKYAKIFDINKLAIVSEDSKKYYLIDKDGSKVSEDYDLINSYNGYYIAVNDNKKGLLDGNGKQIVPCEYENVELINLNKKYIIATNEYGKNIVINFENSKEIVKSTEKPILNNHYIEIDKEDKNEYYTYNGKLFFEGKKNVS
ncbi:MAG: hypothetical protein E7158_02770 [Firmicutes bacterium]|nr:hypothetical protein [Bacillota bacterium]